MQGIEQSENISEWVKAFFLFQQNYQPPAEDQSGQVGGKQYNYASLSSIIRSYRAQLIEVGMFFVQDLAEGNIATTVYHAASGQWKCSSTPIIANASRVSGAGKVLTSSVQDLGGGITYMKRYALCAILGVSAAGEDNDAAPRQQRQQQQTRSTTQSSGNQNQQPSEKAKYALKMNIKELEALDAATANILKEEMMALHKSGVWGKTLCSQYIDKLQAAKEAAGNKQAAPAVLDDVPF